MYFACCVGNVYMHFFLKILWVTFKGILIIVVGVNV